MKPRWATVPAPYLKSTDGRAFEVIDLDTRTRELVQLPDPPRVRRRKRKPRNP